MTEPFNPNPPQAPPLRPPRPARDSATQRPAGEAVVDETPADEEAEEQRRELVHPKRAPAQNNRRTAIRIGAAVAIALAVGVGLWLVLRDNDSSSTSPASPPPVTGTNSPPVPISLNGLQTIARLGFPIYWAGKRPGTTLEMTKKADNGVVIRYLPDGVPVGVKVPYLTVGTYPLKHAFDVTSKLAAQQGSVPIPVGKNRVATYSTSRPTNVYLAEKGSDYQIEVYDPTPDRAQQLVRSGQIEAIR